VTVFIDATANPQLVDQAIQGLHSLNRTDRMLNADDSLSAPELGGCLPVEVPPILGLPDLP
jgi:hypothetical protein